MIDPINLQNGQIKILQIIPEHNLVCILLKLDETDPDKIAQLTNEKSKFAIEYLISKNIITNPSEDWNVMSAVFTNINEPNNKYEPPTHHYPGRKPPDYTNN